LFPLRHNGCYSDLSPALDLWSLAIEKLVSGLWVWLLQ
jgi:hypothetical protein